MNPYDSNDQTFRFKNNFGASIDGVLNKADQPGTEQIREQIRTADGRGEVMEIIRDALADDEITGEEAVTLTQQLEEVRDGDENEPEELAGNHNIPQVKGVEDTTEDVEQKAGRSPADIVQLGNTSDDEEAEDTLGESVNSRWGERMNGTGGE